MSYTFYSKEDVKNKYIAKGSFYHIKQGYSKGYRNDLHIFDKSLVSSEVELRISKPDILFIMMNPGGSRPLVNTKNYIDEDKLIYWLLGNNLVDAKPDFTQDQIMRIMWNTGAQHCRIINISDIREGSSKKFYPQIRNTSDFHSIFSSSRQQELYNVFKGLDSEAFIFKAWGVGENLSLRKIVDRCIKSLPSSVKVIGLEKNNYKHLCYHPYSPRVEVRKKWFYDAMELIGNEIPDGWYRMLATKYGNFAPPSKMHPPN